jgi:ATP/ADP translocase
MSIILNGIKNNAFYILIYSLLLVITISFVDLYYKFDKLIDKLIEQDKKIKEKEEKEEKEKEEKDVVEGEDVISRPSTPVMTLDDDLNVD